MDRKEGKALRNQAKSMYGHVGTGRCARSCYKGRNDSGLISRSQCNRADAIELSADEGYEVRATRRTENAFSRLRILS